MPCSATAADIPALPSETLLDIQASAVLPVDDIIKGDIVYVNISLSEAAPIYAFEAVLEYNEAILSYKGFETDIANDSPIKVERNDEGNLCVAVSEFGEHSSDISKKLCTISFSARSSGKTTVTVKSVTAVFDDMTYMSVKPNADVEINIKKPSSDKTGGGGGGGRGGISIGGTSTSSAAPVAEVPDLPEADNISEPSVNNDVSDFYDVDNEHWAFSYIKKLTESGVILGYEDGSFKPDNNVTRAEFTKLIFSVCNFELSGEENQIFSDVSRDDWCFLPVATMASYGIVNGSGGLFRPNDIITREDAAVILKRCLDKCGINPTMIRENINFADEADISDYAVWPIDVLYTAGLISGDDMRRFNPLSGLTRAEAAAMTARFKEIIGGSDDEA